MQGSPAPPLSLTGPGILDYMELVWTRLELLLRSRMVKKGCLILLFISLLTGLASPILGGKKSMHLSAADQELLFQVARDSILAHLKGQPDPLPPEAPPILAQPMGVFVTLNRQGRLRGCIGYLEAVKPLIEAVREMALAAAFRDPRFPPLREEELADLEMEISILSPMRQIKDVEEVQVGRDGLYLEQGPCRGLLLPQVATQCGWDRDTFLSQTCCKAGLPADAWKNPATKIYVFSADILHEPPKK